MKKGEFRQLRDQLLRQWEKEKAPIIQTEETPKESQTLIVGTIDYSRDLRRVLAVLMVVILILVAFTFVDRKTDYLNDVSGLLVGWLNI